MSLNVLDALSKPLKHNFLNFFVEYIYEIYFTSWISLVL